MNEDNNNMPKKEESHEHMPKKEETFTIRKDTLWKYSTFVLAALVVVMAFVAFNGGDSPTGNVVANPTAAPSVPAQAAQVTASANGGARMGSEDAPIVIVEFSDFQCPFCSRAAPTLKQIVSEYGDEVAVVYRHFPLSSIHPNAQKAAEASECVRKQGGDEAFWTYHDTLFANQQALGQDNLRTWAQDQGYDIGECLSSGEFASLVNKDTLDAQAAGGRGTPYSVVVCADGTGTAVSGAQPFGAFDSVIKACG